MCKKTKIKTQKVKRKIEDVWMEEEKVILKLI